MKFVIVLALAIASTIAYPTESLDGYKFEVQHDQHYPALQVEHHHDQESSEEQIEEQHNEVEHYVDYVGHPKYHYEYAVHDPHTHDVKNQWEIRDGEYVKGEYNVVQPDGKTRVVKYESDGKHGINYDVKYIHGHH